MPRSGGGGFDGGFGGSYRANFGRSSGGNFDGSFGDSSGGRFGGSFGDDNGGWQIVPRRRVIYVTERYYPPP
jgi:hypothetical protein